MTHRANGLAKLPPAIFLVGPTASGKTELAFALCREFPCEIISVDSAQVFRHMNIGTAKPDATMLAKYPHRLIDLIDPTERYSAARFCTDALAAMKEITDLGRIPLLVGGTMLYVKALREGLAELPVADANVRTAIDLDAKTRGWPAMHAELARLDAATAARLKPTDSQRIQRALEVIQISGRAMSSIFSEQSATPLPYQCLALALIPSSRTELHQRIANRFDAMLENGLVDEVIALRKKYSLSDDLPSMRCVGYRQVWEMLEGTASKIEMRERGVFATRQFAKRQLTWLRSMPEMETLDALDVEMTSMAKARVAEFLASWC
ncbi:MAG: tRNA (adenosine(37)-N6)-dimethylallyltransferase MiaA [Rhodocyclaceae bacterium]|nr:tRNA (adenosine(37)-N6)-dimethylallyltransferase MiaA [Rhodocyclaceae bacterium]